MVITPIQDNLLEAPETRYFCLLPGDGYTVNPNLNFATTTLLDSTVSTSQPQNIPAFETIYNTLSNYLSANPVVFGAAVAFNPEILFASPFVFQGENGLERTNIADAIDYTQTVWYQTPLQLESAAFSPPYFDVGGAGEDVVLSTYSIPLFDTNSDLVAIVTNDLLLATVNDLTGQQTRIRTALSDFAANFNPDQNGDGQYTNEDLNGIYSNLENYLSGSPTVFGSAFAFNPEVLNASPFVFRGENGLERTDIASTIDYTQTVWYQTPLQLGSAAFSPPYFDVGGAGEDVLLTTYSIPVFNQADSSLIGVLTSDLLLGSFTPGEIEAQRAVIQNSAFGLAQDLSNLLHIPFSVPVEAGII